MNIFAWAATFGFTVKQERGSSNTYDVTIRCNTTSFTLTPGQIFEDGLRGALFELYQDIEPKPRKR
jgi:hypothetical protein